jgi:Protein of unknown function (DUF3987)/DnaB-like helicase N terminal domain
VPEWFTAMSRAQRTPPPPDPIEEMPASVDAETFTLAAMFNARSLPAVREQLQADDFTRQKHRRVFLAALEVDRRGERIEIVTLVEELTKHRQLSSVGGMAYVASLAGMPEIVDIASSIRIVKDKSRRRRIIDAADGLAKRAISSTEETDSVIAAGAEFFASLQSENGQPKESAPSAPAWPDPLHEDAFHGVAGDLVRAIAKESEADPAGLLLQVLVGFGNMAGRGPYIAVEGDRHHTNENAVLVGISSIARKGTSWGRVRAPLEAVDQHWAENCLLSGLGSGEALIEALGDTDHRRLLYEPEFARVLAVIARDGTTLSAVLRQCWDQGAADIKVRGKGEVHVRGAHLSAICHVTKDELLRKLSATELANGFANRDLFACVARSQELPFGGDSIHYGDAINRLRDATAHARKMGNTRVEFDRDARALWVERYHDLTVGRPGLFGDLIARRAPHVLRLSLNYALLDCAKQVRVEHLRAALAVWHYCEQSTLYIWGDRLGDPTADEMLRALRAAGDAGLTKWDVTNHFGRNKPAAEIDRAVGVLAERGLVRTATEKTGGRDSTRYWAA